MAPRKITKGTSGSEASSRPVGTKNTSGTTAPGLPLNDGVGEGPYEVKKGTL